MKHNFCFAFSLNSKWLSVYMFYLFSCISPLPIVFGTKARKKKYFKNSLFLLLFWFLENDNNVLRKEDMQKREVVWILCSCFFLCFHAFKRVQKLIWNKKRRYNCECAILIFVCFFQNSFLGIQHSQYI